MSKYKVFNPEKVKKNFTRVLVLSDLHCGHQLGLTPNSWQYNPTNEVFGHLSKIQMRLWKWFKKEIKKIDEIDVLIVNGDLIDGRGERNGSTELLTTDRHNQVEIAIECLEPIISKMSKKEIYITRGTPYHTGDCENFENVLAQKIGAKIDNVFNLTINGKKINVRHKVGGSSVPHGKATSVLKEAIWETIKSSQSDRQPADIVIRSHVHNMIIIRDSMRYSITTPALQYNSNYGQLQCSGLTDFGFLIIDIFDDGEIRVSPRTTK